MLQESEKITLLLVFNMYIRQMLENSIKDDKTHSFCSLKCIVWQSSD